MWGKDHRPTNTHQERGQEVGDQSLQKGEKREMVGQIVDQVVVLVIIRRLVFPMETH